MKLNKERGKKKLKQIALLILNLPALFVNIYFFIV